MLIGTKRFYEILFFSVVSDDLPQAIIVIIWQKVKKKWRQLQLSITSILRIGIGNYSNK